MGARQLTVQALVCAGLQAGLRADLRAGCQAVAELVVGVSQRRRRAASRQQQQAPLLAVESMSVHRRAADSRAVPVAQLHLTLKRLAKESRK